MKVKEVIDMLSYGTPYILIGGATGHILHDSIKNKKKHAEKYYECDTTHSPLYADMAVSKDMFVKNAVNKVTARIGIWVSGK